ncbi:hypothetical protein EIN_308540 [Entamoeba invadens IP1]|uniref:ABC3 transporter permease C-terminal domain-containing protein n=1 Tax=Entamoeba invadens IP1 TaxID=370355 RepID=A0A0A1U296_ENTIV|nr:hypothetical protein EIN_308540 [Entamoeba invadens IP1]ELP86758.1 hypothetical protein EIN_308540 [Entamoeba invadens IP1]|eukprot:XP_004186104.1 hypothetical protein EIN_308540 [Entamoeba invadens IP1]
MEEKYQKFLESEETSATRLPDAFVLNMTVKYLFGDTQDKLAGSPYAIFAEYNAMSQTLFLNAPQHLTQFKTFISSYDFNECASEVLVNVPTPRTDYYQSNDYAVLQRDVTGYLSQVLYDLSFNKLTSTTPVLEGLSMYKYANVMLGMIVDIAVIVLLALSVLLVHSLLTINFDAQSATLKIQRTIGTRRLFLGIQLVSNSLFYTFPALVLGAILSTLIFIISSIVIGKVFEVDITFYPTALAIILAIVLSFLVPIIATIFPLYDILTKELTTRPSTSHVVSIKRKRSSYISWYTIFLGIFGTAYGIMTYLILPRAMLALNLTAMFAIFAVFILFLLIGSVMLCLNVTPLIERLLLYLLYFWDRAGLPMAIKNLLAHKLRNRKTSILFGLSLGFILFFFSAFSSEMGTLKQSILKMSGAEMTITTVEGSFKTVEEANLAYREIALRVAKADGVEGVTFSFENLMWTYRKSPVATATLGQKVIGPENIVPVLPNAFYVFYDDYLDVTRAPEDTSIGDLDQRAIPKYLYSTNGFYKALTGQTLVDLYHITGGDKIMIVESNALRTSMTKFMSFLSVSGVLKSAPFFTISSSPLMTWQDLLVSLPEYVRIGKNYVSSIDEVEIVGLHIKIQEDNAEMAKRVGSLVASPYFKTAYTSDFLSQIDTVNLIMTFYLVFVTIIALVTSFFSVLSAMYANVQEQIREIAVLRAIGAGRFLLVRVYLAESFVVIFAASLLGMVVGCLVGFTMTLQIILFTQTPVGFTFPTVLFVIVIVCAIIFAGLSTFLPLFRILRKQPMELFREDNR